MRAGTRQRLLSGTTAAGITVAGLALIGCFGLFGPGSLFGRCCILVCIATLASLAPRPPILAVWPLAGGLLLLPQLVPGFFFFDLVVFAAFLAAVLWTARQDDRRVWNVGVAGLLCAATLIVPLLALPTAVVSLKSFLGEYKLYVSYVVVFLALRRLVRPEDSRILLWIGPVVGLLASVQLLLKTSGAGVVSLQKLTLRNFHTNVGWGQSNYIAAVLALCLFLSLLLFLLDRRFWVRAAVVAAGAFMLQSFSILYSRTSTIALLTFVLVLILGKGGRFAIITGATAIAAGTAIALSPFGTVLASRFTNPAEFASAKVRIDLWKSAIERFERHPWTGAGLNQGRYQMDILDVDLSHNTMLDYLSSQGVFGAVVFLALLFAMFRVAFAIHVAGLPADQRTIRVVCIATLTAVAVTSMAEPTWNAYTYSMILVYFVAWMTLQRRPRPGTPHAAPDG